MNKNDHRIAHLPSVIGWLIAGSIAAGLAGCSSQPAAESSSDEEESWAVTAWGELYELFPEVDALVAGETAMAHTHVTVLDGFPPMTVGTVEIVLRSGSRQQGFLATEPVRPGIFNVAIQPDAAGDYDLSFRIESEAGIEEIEAGRVRVGTAAEPGLLIESFLPPGADGGGEPLSFLKEQQWRTEFSTAWVTRGSLAQSVEGAVRVRPPAGGEATITAPIDAVLLSTPWPYPGRRVSRGDALMQLVPRIAPERSLGALEAERSTLEAELQTAEARLARLRELFEVEATSRRELEEAEATVERTAGRLGAAQRDLEAARSAREGGTAGATTLKAPFSGEISAVHASPGEAVAAGAPLARLVRTDSVWLEVAVPPEAGRRLSRGAGGIIVSSPEGSALEITQADVRLVSMAPEVEPRTGTVAVLFEVPPSPELILGTTGTAQILLVDRVEGIVVPTSALIGDGGVTVVYLQLSGEEFARQPVTVVARQGEVALVEGLAVGQRLVTRGGESIRRASLLSTGEAQGHVH